MKEKLKKLIELLKSDESLARELFTITDPESAQTWMASHGIDMTLDGVKTIEARLAPKGEEDKELSDGELKNVAGGSFVDDFVEEFEGLMKLLEDLGL